MRPVEDGCIKFHILWLNDVDIQEVAQSTVGFLSERNVAENAVRIDITEVDMF